MLGLLGTFCLLILTRTAHAAETDNFNLPSDVEFADLGGFLETLHTYAIESGVDKVNSRIERALNLKAPQSREYALSHAHGPSHLAEAVAECFGPAPYEMPIIEKSLKHHGAQEAFPGQLIRHYDISMNLRGRMPLDPRGLFMLSQSSTIRADGVYFGTDKLVHFHQLGRQYYHHYRNLIEQDLEPEDARRKTIQHFAHEAVLAESHLFGTLLTGIYSNADMAANYIGFLFLINLTERVSLQGEWREPLVVRCGLFWRVNDHVYPGSGWFRPFISHHLNEALNPNRYDKTMRPHIHRLLEDRAASIVDFYTTQAGMPRAPSHFEELARELSNYHGEPYGHSGHFEELMHIGNTCLPATQPKTTGSSTILTP